MSDIIGRKSGKVHPMSGTREKWMAPFDPKTGCNNMNSTEVVLQATHQSSHDASSQGLSPTAMNPARTNQVSSGLGRTFRGRGEPMCWFLSNCCHLATCPCRSIGKTWPSHVQFLAGIVSTGYACRRGTRFPRVLFSSGNRLAQGHEWASPHWRFYKKHIPPGPRIKQWSKLVCETGRAWP